MDTDDCLRKNCQSMQELSLTFVIDGEKDVNAAALVSIVHHFDREITIKRRHKAKNDTFN